MTGDLRASLLPSGAAEEIAPAMNSPSPVCVSPPLRGRLRMTLQTTLFLGPLSLSVLSVGSHLGHTWVCAAALEMLSAQAHVGLISVKRCFV